MRSHRLGYNFRIKPGQKMGILRVYLNGKSGGILKHLSNLFLVAFVRLNGKHLTSFRSTEKKC